MSVDVNYDEEGRKEHKVNGEKVPSVTQILKVLDKSGPLMWWSWRLGLQSIAARVERGETLPGNWEILESELKRDKETPNHARNKSAARGTGVHDAAELWALEQTVPNPNDFPEEERGYVQALALWITEQKPEYIETEIPVGSAEHGFIGKFDFRAKVDGKVVIGDYKTSKGIYVEHFLQLAAYELASVEMGNEPTEGQLVVRLGADGTYEQAFSRATGQQFLAVKSAYDAYKEANEGLKEAKKEAKQAVKEAA